MYMDLYSQNQFTSSQCLIFLYTSKLFEFRYFFFRPLLLLQRHRLRLFFFVNKICFAFLPFLSKSAPDKSGSLFLYEKSTLPFSSVLMIVKLFIFTVKQFPPAAVEKLDGGALIFPHVFEAHLFRVPLMMLRL